MKQNSKQKAAPGTMKRVLQALRPYRGLILLSVLFSTAAVALTLYLPVLVGRAIDHIAGPGRVAFDEIGSLLLEIALIAGLTALVQWLVSVINNRVTYQVVRDIRVRAFRHLQRLPLSWLDGQSVGSVVSRIITDVDQFADGLLLGFTQLFTGVVTILGTLVFMISIKPLIAGIVIVLTPLSFVVARFIASHTHQYFLDQSKTRAEQTAYVDELLGNQKVVKAFGREERSVTDFDEINDRLEGTSLKAIFFSSLTNPCTRFVNSVVYAAVVLTGALLCVSTAGTAAAFTVGSLSALLAYANQYTKPFNEISGVVTEFQNALACAGRIFELMDQPAETPDPPEAVNLGQARGEVALEELCFSYDKSKPLIENLSFTAKPGQRVAIVGPTGCGKTTLINLLMRFYDSDGGAIRVDGKELRELTRESLRANYGMVLQETWLRSGTIRENLTLGKPDATDAEIEAACRAAHAHSFIRLLPQGYDTVIGEDGGMLSQGQKQLLCIARIMLCLPPMLILDEATSSIDTRTEIRIQKAFAAMMRGRTSFIVAHRLSTIREADVILVMKDGKVIEIGNHERLLAAGGFYAKLYNSQFEQ
ncbi:MAG: ABC transporter ATP-binding protein [Oscillospiraceae bacterium]|nr:ABC transporter ATP-binding protein [Oscillospiraceae bacterium]